MAAASKTIQPSAKAVHKAEAGAPPRSHITIGIGFQKISMMNPAATAAMT